MTKNNLYGFLARHPDPLDRQKLVVGTFSTRYEAEQAAVDSEPALESATLVFHGVPVTEGRKVVSLEEFLEAFRAQAELEKAAKRR